MLAEKIEREVVELYRRVRLPAPWGAKLEAGLMQLIARREQDGGKAATTWAKRLARLGSEREKILAAYYAEAMPLEQFKREQAHIDNEVAFAQEQIGLAGTKLDESKAVIQRALRIARNWHVI